MWHRCKEKTGESSSGTSECKRLKERCLKKVVSSVLAVVLVLMGGAGWIPQSIGAAFAAEPTVHEGSFYTNVSVRWRLDTSTGVLSIYGPGAVSDELWDAESGKALGAFWQPYAAGITEVSIASSVVPVNMDAWFSGCTKLKEISFSGVDTSRLTSANEMFQNCFALASIDFSGFDTSQVTNMREMFDSCTSLKSLDLSHFDTSKVTDMSGMFDRCTSLASLDLSSFNTARVSDMSGMFWNCNALAALELSGFKTCRLANMYGMFCGCRTLTSLDVSAFDTSGVTTMANLFSGCAGLTSLDLSNFDTAQVTNIYGMFSGCPALESLDLSSFDTSKTVNMGVLFLGAASLDRIKLGTEWSFKGAGTTVLTTLPQPPVGGAYDGTWTLRGSANPGQLPPELSASYTAKDAGTYVWTGSKFIEVGFWVLGTDGQYVKSVSSEVCANEYLGKIWSRVSGVTPARASDASFDYAFFGWVDKAQNGRILLSADPADSCFDAARGVYLLDVYAAFTATARKRATVPDVGSTTDASGSYTLRGDLTAVWKPSAAYRRKARVTVPTKVVENGKTYTVVGLSASAFLGDMKLKTIDLGSRLTSIPAAAFSKASKLTKVVGGSKVATIGSKAFYGDAKLTSLPAFASLKSIGASAFRGDTALKTMKISSTSLASIGCKAFYGDTKLKKVRLSTKKLASLGRNSFSKCSRLTLFVCSSRVSTKQLKAAGLS